MRRFLWDTIRSFGVWLACVGLAAGVVVLFFQIVEALS